MPSSEMCRKILTPLATAVMLSVSCPRTNAQTGIPRAEETICQPTYLLKNGHTFSAGKAWAARLPNSQKSVLISVMHVFGPAGGLDTVIPARNLPGMVSKVTLQDLSKDTEIGEAGAELLNRGEGPPSDGDESKDLVAFELPPNYPRRVLSLSDRPARINSKCWLITYVLPNTASEFSGVVVESSPTGMAFKPDEQVFTQATSGSPVVNESGEVIGMLVGHDNVGRIWCNPGYRIRQRLQAEVSAK